MIVPSLKCVTDREQMSSFTPMNPEANPKVWVQNKEL